MNICLTTECNNHCPFCFQKELHKDVQSFTLENLEKVLTWAQADFKDINQQNGVSLLGGEPTLYPHLEEAIQLVYKILGEDTNILFITNLLCSTECMNMLLKYPKLKYLVNISYDQSKENIFKENLHMLSQHTKEITFSITLTPNPRLNRVYINRLYAIQKETNYDFLTRVGLERPGPYDTWTNIYNYSAELQEIAKSFIINFDCSINQCEVPKEVQYALLDRSSGMLPKCVASPLDILPDLSARYCYSSDSVKFGVKNILDFPSLKSLSRYFIDIGIDSYEVKNKKCSTCDKYLSRKCIPCHCVDGALLRGEAANGLS